MHAKIFKNNSHNKNTKQILMLKLYKIIIRIKNKKFIRFKNKNWDQI